MPNCTQTQTDTPTFWVETRENGTICKLFCLHCPTTGHGSAISPIRATLMAFLDMTHKCKLNLQED